MEPPPANSALIEPVGALILLNWPEPSGSEPLPPEFADATDKFRHAETEFDAGRYVEAAEGFFAAAAAVPKGADEFYADGFVGARSVAYRNAAIAFQSAERPDLARAAFTPLLDRDPDCAETLREILRGLEH